MSKQLMRDWDQIETQQFDGMARSQEIASHKLSPSFETPDNAKKQEKAFGDLFRC